MKGFTMFKFIGVLFVASFLVGCQLHDPEGHNVVKAKHALQTTKTVVYTHPVNAVSRWCNVSRTFLCDTAIASGNVLYDTALTGKTVMCDSVSKSMDILYDPMADVVSHWGDVIHDTAVASGNVLYETAVKSKEVIHTAVSEWYEENRVVRQLEEKRFRTRKQYRGKR